eukprot:TRINITY_DN23128_c0_g1_i1.p2 TRINITY_DN23128_c0_g1~~TRINITY_DN23128_c0_g1_i1.p2  ORF type:complete len:112 (+),score=14.00 TRINITY_DN23128_c0_g1_i1:49-384(+)
MKLCKVVSEILFFQAEDGIRDAQESRGLGMCIRDSKKTDSDQPCIIAMSAITAASMPGKPGVGSLGGHARWQHQARMEMRFVHPTQPAGPSLLRVLWCCSHFCHHRRTSEA